MPKKTKKLGGPAESTSFDAYVFKIEEFYGHTEKIDFYTGMTSGMEYTGVNTRTMAVRAVSSGLLVDNLPAGADFEVGDVIRVTVERVRAREERRGRD